MKKRGKIINYNLKLDAISLMHVCLCLLSCMFMFIMMYVYV